ncbi:MAG: pilus assembly protein PilP [Rhodocyclaceae bacterium]|nr:pilus assembly protein PilP [Rhodocyclaceae bacterium]MCP5297956.1 pilus assembly protein PilP [Zoogloeaceae bacterium]MCW5596913.1 pilus assembly protein PilP [Rhodocyclaceae bacterium]
MRRAAILLGCLMLAACGGEDHQDLRQWMKESTKDFKGKIPPLPEIKSFPTVAYEAGDLVEPYNASKIEPERKAGGGGIKPDLDRRKEPLEAYPLESLKMVGTLTKGKMVHALVQADKNLHQVKIGNYMGQNFGIITDINETEVQLKELVPDSLGDYTERTSTLQLQEKQQEGRK